MVFECAWPYQPGRSLVRGQTKLPKVSKTARPRATVCSSFPRYSTPLERRYNFGSLIDSFFSSAHCSKGNNSMLTALWTVFLLLVGQQMMSATGVAYGHHPSSYGVYGTYEATSYLPAPPGQRPKCASEGDTFCSTIDYYPT